MRKRFAPLTVTEVDPVLDFIDRALTRLGLSTASRLPLERPGELQLSFRTRAGPFVLNDADLALPEGLSPRQEDAAYIIPLKGGKPSRLNV